MVSVQQLLPKKFLGFIPLYIGVELVLGISILNKISGFYGMLSLFTGHPLDFFQCLYYLTSIIIVPFYVSMLRHLSITLPTSAKRFKASTINKVSFFAVLYSFDTVLSSLFTLYFSWFWFSGTAEAQDSEISNSIADDIAGAANFVSQNSKNQAAEVAAAAADVFVRALDEMTGSASTTSSESASTTYESFFTISSILVVTVIRVYFTLIVLSFTRNLIKGAKYNSVNDNEVEDMNTDFLEGNIFQRKLRELEFKAANYLKNIFN